MTSVHTAVSDSSVEQELRRDVRAFTALALAITLMLTISTCHYHRSLDSTIGLKITSLDLSAAESIDSAENPPNLTSWKNSIAANGYYITGASQRRTPLALRVRKAILGQEHSMGNTDQSERFHASS